MALNTLSDVKLIELPRHLQQDGSLVVLEQHSGLPFTVTRMFTVTAGDGAVRGRHAHRSCSQLFLCLCGAVEVECDDGQAKQIFRLNRSNLALIVPPSIWARETYRGERSLLAVLCDRLYDEADYIRSYPEFLAWRQEQSAQ
jgi:dTDP-4-dehydrorhamnose 3,5-epimerase-like enzyme